MRKHRHYDDGSAHGADADLKPGTGDSTPVRAWLMPQENDLPPGYATDGGPWTMVIEDGPPPDSIAGEFESLVEAAARAGAVECLVWSPRRHPCQQFDGETVRIID